MTGERRWVMLFFAGLGAFTLLGQVTLFRESFLLFTGNELSAALQLALWLSLTGLGGALGTRLSARWTPWLAGLLPVFGAWMILAVRVLPLLGEADPAQEVPFFRALGLLLAAQLPLNVTAGMLFPLTLRRAQMRGVPLTAGGAYLAEAVGAAVAGALFSFLLAGRAPGVSVIAAAAAAMAGLVAAMPGLRRLPQVLCGATALLFLTLGVTGAGADALDRFWWAQRQAGAERVLTLETPYQRLDVERWHGQHTLYSNGVPVATFEDLDETCSGYRMADLFLSLHTWPNNILVIGHGEPTLVRRILEHGVARLVYVPSDPRLLPALHEAALPGIPSVETPGLSLATVDGRRFLADTAETFDLVVLDLPLPLTAAENRFFTVEAFRAIKGRLRPGGALILEASLTTHYIAGEAEELLASVRRGLTEVFGRVETLAGDSIVFVAGGDGEMRLEYVARRFAQRPIFVSLAGREILDEQGKREYFKALFGPFFDAFRRERYTTGGMVNAAPNRDARPVAYYLAVKRWAQEAGIGVASVGRSGAGGGQEWFGARAIAFVAAPLVVAGGLVLLAYSLTGRRRDGRGERARKGFFAVAMLAAGWTGMLAEMVLIFAYQSRFGMMYRDIGALYAIYMAGLTAGSFVAERRLVAVASGTRAVCAVRLALIAAAGAALAGAGAGGAGATCVLLLAVALALGFEYPILNEFYRREEGGESGAGVLHSMDHLGAGLAALFGATVAIPLAGSAAALGAVMAVNVILLAVWLLLRDLK